MKGTIMYLFYLQNLFKKYSVLFIENMFASLAPIFLQYV